MYTSCQLDSRTSSVPSSNGLLVSSQASTCTPALFLLHTAVLSTINMVTAKSAASKKRRSSAAEATTNADVVAAVKSSSKTGTKKRKVASTTTSAPPLTAVAARRLAAEQQLALQKQQEEEASKQEASTAADAEDAASQNSEAHIEDSDQEEDIDESEDDDEGPIASTSREPYDPDIKFHDGPPKRYFLGGAASLNSSGAASPINVEDNEIEEASFAVSEGEYINTGGDISRAESVTYSKRPSRRRRRAENAAKWVTHVRCIVAKNQYTDTSHLYR